MANWKFLPNPGREEEGLGHAGIETFKGSPYPGIARESSQNSLDAAARKIDGTPTPVHLVFRYLSVPALDIPGLIELRETFQTCLDQAIRRNLKKNREFFERAIQITAQNNIAVLSIEDYGTTGLIGPATEGKPFHALVKASGVSQKEDADASGSFGIGKNAAFAISNLRTVFYSTLYGSPEERHHLVQGKSILVSHEPSDGNPNRATGYWGDKDFMPIMGKTGAPTWLQRNKIGTTVACIGFVEEPDWHWQIIESLIRNFFSAINAGAVSFSVWWSEQDHLQISSTNLEDIFDRSEVRAAAGSSGTSDDLDFSKAMLLALKSSAREIETKTFKDIGTFRLTLLQSDGFPRRMGFLRNGMYIADNLRHFGHAMARFPMSRDFVAVLEPDDRTTSELIRDMESPRHDEISADRLDDLSQRRKLKSAMKMVGEWVRSTIKSATTKPAGAEVLLDEMNRFFSSPSEGPTIPDPANKNDDPERTTLTTQNTTKSPPPGAGTDDGQSGGAGSSRSSSAKGGSASIPKKGTRRGNSKGRGGLNIPIESLRNSASSNGRERTISFTPCTTAIAHLEISAIGIANDETLNVRSVDGVADVKGRRIELNTGVRKTVKVVFDKAYHGPISVVLTPAGGPNAN